MIHKKNLTNSVSLLESYFFVFLYILAFVNFSLKFKYHNSLFLINISFFNIISFEGHKLYLINMFLCNATVIS